MSRLTIALENDYSALRLLRDELALHASLFEADMKDRWKDLEVKLDLLREHLQRAQVAAGQAGKDIDQASTTLLKALQSGYADIKRALGP